MHFQLTCGNMQKQRPAKGIVIRKRKNSHATDNTNSSAYKQRNFSCRGLLDALLTCGNAQRKWSAKRIVVRQKWPRLSAAGCRLQHGRLNLQVPLQQLEIRFDLPTLQGIFTGRRCNPMTSSSTQHCTDNKHEKTAQIAVAIVKTNIGQGRNICAWLQIRLFPG